MHGAVQGDIKIIYDVFACLLGRRKSSWQAYEGRSAAHTRCMALCGGHVKIIYDVLACVIILGAGNLGRLMKVVVKLRCVQRRARGGGAGRQPGGPAT